MTSYIARLFYLGDRYHGSQCQPGLNTVQSELIEAVKQWSGTPHSTQTVQLAGRTDRGVHSVGQIVQILSEKELEIDRINRHLPWDITLWACAEAPYDFRPRFDVLMRHYRYYFESPFSHLDLSSMRRALQLLIGSHDFSLLSKPDGNRPTITTILNGCLTEHKGTLTIDLFGTNFLWKLVRKTVSLLLQIGTGASKLDIITDIISGRDTIPGGIRPAPPECLVLIETVVPIRMKSTKHAKKRIQKHVSSHLRSLERSKTTIAAVNEDYFSS